jgi:hypothetical protein
MTKVLSIAAFLAAFFALSGCGRGSAAKVVYGNVAYNGQKVTIGSVAFVPADGNRGQSRAAKIIDGQYRIDTKGGLPLGKYTVQVDAKRATGRKVKGFNGTETAMIDEQTPLGPPAYSGPQSPLKLEITADFDGKYDITIPQK